MTYSLSTPDLKPQYDRDLDLESRNYWCGQTGQERPPAPSLRKVGSKLVLGRYMDPWGCQAIMNECKARWSAWYTTFLVGAGIGIVLCGTVISVLIFFTLPVLAVWYLTVKHLHRRQYDYYWAVQQEILSTGQSIWVPFDKKRLIQVEHSPRLVWP